ncbi:hypothetical protein [Galbibacter sp. PAP.153]|uniref:hypothetical protein n=1 Tax=Galbibacter sp. PAP.153 TaxID=3104623 RepID=UPI0030093D7C
MEGTFIFDTVAGLNLITKKFADKIKILKPTNEFFTGHRATGEALSLVYIITKLELLPLLGHKI